MTRDQKHAYQRAYRQANGNACTNKYEKTPRGFLMRKYRNMQSRVTGIQSKKAHLYKDLPILPRNEFYEWAWDHPEFWRLYQRWVVSSYERKLCPTVNRIDPSKGYLLDNMEWITHSVNSALANRHRISVERLHVLATTKA